MLAFDLLRVALARTMDSRGEIPFVRAPRVCVIARDAEGLKQGLQLQKHLVRTPTENVSQDSSSTVINSVPEPARLLLLTDEAPHFVHFGFVHALQDDLDLARGQACNDGAIHR